MTDWSDRAVSAADAARDLRERETYSPETDGRLSVGDAQAGVEPSSSRSLSSRASFAERKFAHRVAFVVGGVRFWWGGFPCA